MLPQEVDRDSLEGIDEGEEEVLDEELVMGWIKVVEGGHESNEDFTELILTFGSDACALEE